MNSSVGEGGILRRSTATLHGDDTVTHCSLAASALGSKLMLEVIEAALTADALPVFVQPRGGRSLLGVDYGPARREAVRRDLASGWLADELRALQDF